MIKRAIYDYLSKDSKLQSFLGKNPFRLFLNSNKFEDKTIPQIIYYVSAPQMENQEENLFYQDFTFEVFADNSINGTSILARLIELMNLFAKANIKIKSDNQNLTVRAVWLISSRYENTFKLDDKIKYTNAMSFRILYTWNLNESIS